MKWIRADELTEDDVVVETWTESDLPQQIRLRILNIVREDDRVNVLFATGRDFSYDPGDQVQVVDHGPVVSGR